MDKLPTLGRSHRRGALGRWLGVLVVLAVATGLTFTFARRHSAGETDSAAPAPGLAANATQAVGKPAGTTDGRAAPAEAPAPAAPAEAHAPVEPSRVTVTISGPLERALVAQLGKPLGQPLTQVTVRALAWWVSVPADLRRGDKIDVLYEERKDEEPVLDAIRFRSGKTGKTHRAYRFKSSGDKYARLYDENGQEIELRLEDSPLDDYEQITSLLRDGRGHKGVDFKTPVGTPVKSPFEGQVTRKDWNLAMNGDSLEVKEAEGAHRTVMFLHLSEVDKELAPGAKVTRGQVIGRSGNTGHSFAPHLHYQLMSATNEALDPFAEQKTSRRALGAVDRPAFEAQVRRLDGLLD